MIVDLLGLGEEHPDCRNSERVDCLAVSTCPEHGHIEIWINRKPYVIPDEWVEDLAANLVKALADTRKRKAGKRNDRH